MRIATLVKSAAVLAVAAGAGFFALTMPAQLPAGTLAASYTPDTANGETMFNIGGCASCHKTEGQSQRTQLGGGHKLATPFGTFVVPNISMHPEHGIGRWSEDEFATAMLKGVGRGGEHLYPSFPYASYQRMRINDVRDLYAYMRTLPAVDIASHPHELALPFRLRRGLGLWKLMFLDGKTFQDDPARSEQINRGAYLVEGPGHCAECHSPRNALGGIEEGRRLAGGPAPDGKGFVPNVTPHADGLGNWTERDISYLLESGFTPEFDSVGSTMADVIENTKRLSPEDRAAIAAYLKAIPAVANRKD